jgi:predicted Zn-dependent protease
LYRLKILELDFFTDDDKVVDRRALVPDPAVRRAFFQSLDGAERLAEVRLASRPDDPGSLFALSMATGLETDYAALVERRRFGSFSLSKRNQAYAHKLLALNPPVDDAYMTFGTVEYVVGSLPFYLRWLVRLAQISGSKEKAIEDLELVARRGRYYGPLARMTLAVIYVREKRPDKAQVLLTGLAAEFPENPLFRKELLRVSRLAHPNEPARSK